MKRSIILLMLSFLISKSVYAFSLSASTNHVKVNQTATVTVDITSDPGTYTYEWTATAGNITGTGNSVTFNAPDVKAKASIGVTVKNGGSTVWSGTAAILVYKTIIIIKTDDYFYTSWSPGTGYERPQWKVYLDYMQNIAKVKTSAGISVAELNSDFDGAWANVIKGRLATGYHEFYCHGYVHSRFSNETYAVQLADLQNSVSLFQEKVGVTIHGFGSPENANNDDTGRAMNAVPEMKFFYFPDPTVLFTGLNFMTGQTRLDCESGGSTFIISEAEYLANYALYKDRAVNVIQIHPVWWDGAGASMAEWQKIIADMKTQGVTVILPYEYYRMTTDPTFVPDEGPNTEPGDTTPPIISAVASETITTASAEITWTTDEPATSRVEYGTSTVYGSLTALDSSLVTSHVVPLTGLTASSVYHYRVKSNDAAGNPATGSDDIFVTITANGDSTPPSIPSFVYDGTGSDINSISVTNPLTQLSANWGTSTDAESSISKYYYCIGTTAGATNVVGWTNNGASRSITRPGLGLTEGVTYYFSVKAENSVQLQSSARSSNGQFFVVNTDVTENNISAYPNPHSFTGNTPVKFVLKNNSGGQLKIFNMNGKSVRTLNFVTNNELEWNGTNDDGEKVARGIYFYKVTETGGNSVIGRIALK